VPEARVIPRLAQPYPDDDRYPSGWFTHEDCELLAEWARGKLILELGTYLGRSTVAMARTAKHVVTVDHFAGSPLENWYEPGDYLAKTRENLHKYGVARSVTVIATDMLNLACWLKPKAFDGVLVDGAHDFASVDRDSVLALAAVQDYRGVVWDDFNAWWPDVVIAVRTIAWDYRTQVVQLAPGSSMVRLA
jgi:hypothetical protein